MYTAKTIVTHNNRLIIEKALENFRLADLFALRRLIEIVRFCTTRVLMECNCDGCTEKSKESRLDDLRSSIENMNHLINSSKDAVNADDMISRVVELSTDNEECNNYLLETEGSNEMGLLMQNQPKSFYDISQFYKVTSAKIHSNSKSKMKKAELFLGHGVQFNPTLTHSIDTEGFEAFPYLISNKICRNEHHMAFTAFWKRAIDLHACVDVAAVRAADSCNMPGIEFMCDLFYEHNNRALESEQSSVPSLLKQAACLFDMCRSKHLTKRLKTSLSASQERFVSELSKVFYETEDQDDGWSPVTSASAIFALQMTECASCSSEMLENYLRSLLEHRSHDGSWPYSERTSNAPSVYSTAIAIHALAVLKPSGWKQPAKDAANWLKTQWTDLGIWTDQHSKHSDAYLTVLALDAINLADESGEVTFQHDNSPVRHLNIEHLLHRRETQQTEQSKKRGPDPKYTDAEYEKVLESLVKFYDEEKEVGIAWQRAAKENDMPRGNPNYKGAQTPTRRYCERKGLPMPTITWIQNQIKNKKKRKTSGN